MKSPCLVLDTNVVLDLYFFEDGDVAPLRRALDAGAVACRVSDATLEEYRRVLAYPVWGLEPERQRVLVEGYAAVAMREADAAVPVRLPRCRDPDDQKFLSLAASSRADALVSKDRALLKLRQSCARHFRILNPAEAVRWLAPRI